MHQFKSKETGKVLEGRNEKKKTLKKIENRSLTNFERLNQPGRGAFQAKDGRV